MLDVYGSLTYSGCRLDAMDGKSRGKGIRMPASAPKRAVQKGERLEARVSADTKALLQEAASLQGRSVSDFVVQSAFDAAKRTLREHEFVELSRRDRMAFVEALLNPPAASVRLQKAVERHNRVVAPR
jgi:uncharacterized protein (DUF1778 family)